MGDSRDQDGAIKARERGDVRPLETVIGEGRSAGTVLDATIQGKKYKLKVLDSEGRVRNVEVEAGSDGRGRSGSDGRGRDSVGNGGGEAHESSGGRGRGRGR